MSDLAIDYACPFWLFGSDYPAKQLSKAVRISLITKVQSSRCSRCRRKYDVRHNCVQLDAALATYRIRYENMNEADSMLATARAIIGHSRKSGCDLEPLCHNGTFGTDDRYIFLWQKTDEEVCYNLAGVVASVPSRFAASALAFRGRYGEVGVVDNHEAAFELVKAWLLDATDVDGLPTRKIESQGIG